MKPRLLLALAALSLLLCILSGALAVRSWWIEDWMSRSHWKIEGQDAREISWTLLSGRGKLAVGHREIHLSMIDPANWQSISNKPEWSWRAISFAARRGIGGETFLHRLGFHYVDITQDGGSDITMHYHELSVPHWFLCALLLIGPIWWIVLKRKIRMIKPESNNA